MTSAFGFTGEACNFQLLVVQGESLSDEGGFAFFESELFLFYPLDFRIVVCRALDGEVWVSGKEGGSVIEGGI